MRCALAVLATCASLAAAPFVAAASAPRDVEARIDRSQVREGDSLTLQIRLRGEAANERPDFAPLAADFDVLSLEPVHRTTIVNGVRDDSVDWTLELRPKHRGVLEIPALPVGAGSTEPLSVEVAGAAQKAPTLDAAAGGDPVFVEVEVDEPKPYEQQRVLLRVRLWATEDVIEGALEDLKLASAVVEPVGDDRRIPRTLGGVPYTVVERVYSVLPQEGGELRIPPLHFQGRVREARPRASRRSPFGALDDFFQGGLFSSPGFAGSLGLLDRFASARRVDVASRPLVLDVRPRPAGAGGADWLPAQDLELSEAWASDPPVLRVGEAANRRLVIRAKGVAPAQLPELAPPDVDGVKQYAERPSVQADERGAVKTQDTTVIPTRTGMLTLPPVEIAWWDTAADAARKAVIPARRLEVLPGTGGQAAAIADAPSGASSPPPEPEPAVRPNSFPAWSALLGSLAAPLAALAAVFWMRSRTRAAPQARDRRRAERALRRACARGDPARAEAALRALVPHADAGASDLAREVARLHAVRYSGGGGSRGAWTGRELWKAYRATRRRRRVRSAEPGLPPLYPDARSS